MAREHASRTGDPLRLGARSPLVIDRHSLGAVLERGPRALPSSIPIMIDDPTLTLDERTSWERRLTTLNNACGCHEGALGLAAAFPILFALALSSQPGLGLFEPGWLALLLALPLVGAIIGKALGLAVGRFRLRRAVAALGAVMDARSRSSADIAHGA